MKTKLDDMRAAFRLVDAVMANPSLESSQYARLRASGKKLEMSMTGMLWATATAKADAAESWTAYADRRLLKAFLETAAGDDVELIHKGKLVLRAKQRLEIEQHEEITGYEAWEPKKPFQLAGDQKAALRCAAKYLPALPGTEHMEAVSFDEVAGVTATDTLFVMHVSGTALPASFFVPAAVAGFLSDGTMDGDVAVDDRGTGVVLPHGHAYQLLSADLDRYPKKKCHETVEAAKRVPAMLRLRAVDLLTALNVASQFLLDKAEAASVTSANRGISLVVDLPTGKFQRLVRAEASTNAGDLKTAWPIKRLLPWLEYAASISADMRIEYAKPENMSVFRFRDGARVNQLLCADL